MGKRGHNWKARQVVETVIDDSPTKKIKLDLTLKGNYDQSNELVLPSNKRKTIIKKQGENVIKILSKKQRKRLEKIVERKDKKLQRADLLEKLSKVQATEEELRQLTSIASTQTKGLKKLFLEVEKSKADVSATGDIRPKFNSIKGAKKILPDVGVKPKYNRRDPNIVCSESSSSEDESDEDNIDVEEKVNAVEEKIELEKLKTNDEVIEEKVNGVGEINGKVSEKKVEKANDKQGRGKDVDVEKKPAVFVEVYRTEEIQKARLKLPILAEEQQIMEIINENDIVIIAGETGSGKTTQVPQFLYEAGYATNKIIGVTEPRRVAAISMSNRVAEEMNLTSTEVSYLIRFEGNVTELTKIKFMTDGVLLKEIKNDFLLTKYSVIILDEAHERSVYTDILIGFLSRVVPMRKKRNDPLKLIVMSATLRLSDFTENSRLFRNPPPVVNVEARQFPVTIHFNRRTPENYLLEALRKTVKIHNTLPEGGILIFVTGQKEVNFLVRKLRQMFPLKNKAKIVEISKDLNERRELTKRKNKKIKIVPDINLDDYSLPGDHEIDSENSDISDFEDISEDITSKEPLWVLPLYSLLPSQKQTRVFEKPPEGCRLCVVSTNVAETSLTIPNVKYVVDTGKTKSKLYDKVTGVTNYVVTWTSKASANQRAGRAGRTAPGHCYRLYSSAVFNDVFKEFQVPEIQLKPVDDLYLQMKCMHIDKIVNFPFPTAPDLLQLKTAENRLEILGLIENSKVTDLGKTVSKFPILPRFGKMLALSHQFDLLPYTICLVAALSVQEVLTETDKSGNPEKMRLIRKKWAKTGNFLKLGDPMVLLTAVGGAEYANSQGKLEKFCLENGLRQKAIVEIRKLRLQLTNEVNLNIPDLNISVDPALRPPTDTKAKLLRQILLCGMPDKIAKKIDLSELNPEDKRKFKYAYHTENMEDPIFIHRNSVLKKDLPEFVVYQEIYETNKLYMRGITEIEPEWLAIYAPKLCNLTEPLQDPEPSFDKNSGKLKCTVTGTFGKRAFPLPNVVINFPDKPDLYKWFCKFLLEGTICKKLEKYAKNLLHPPITIVKPWAKLQPRVVKILQTVGMHRCKTRDILLEIWDSNPKFLLDEYLLWLPESLHSEVVLMWPPIN